MVPRDNQELYSSASPIASTHRRIAFTADNVDALEFRLSSIQLNWCSAPPTNRGCSTTSVDKSRFASLAVCMTALSVH
ncbi:hypothetical protein PISMIDRAFT_679237 [Pisolithus microcarpus 441]|uniref:Uncharacterized protein n=1 Tax=Pisolithus microcarpus 441 TaxID=765257 RepID=A0A0C9ZMF2_9AGAM|nr:hypothetical protein PISMIDRAFT_679237 [Pisolithus microcarpus 441]